MNSKDIFDGMMNNWKREQRNQQYEYVTTYSYTNDGYADYDDDYEYDYDYEDDYEDDYDDDYEDDYHDSIQEIHKAIIYGQDKKMSICCENGMILIKHGNGSLNISTNAITNETMKKIAQKMNNMLQEGKTKNITEELHKALNVSKVSRIHLKINYNNW